MAEPDNISKIIAALHSKDMVQLIDLVENCNVDINESIEGGITPLLYACMVSSVECMEYLLKNGADIHAITDGENYEGLTALHYCGTDLEKIKMLVYAGIDLNVQDPTGRNFLMEEATKSYVFEPELINFIAKNNFNFGQTNFLGSMLLTTLVHTLNGTVPNEDGSSSTSPEPIDLPGLTKTLLAIHNHYDLNSDVSQCALFDLGRMGFVDSANNPISNFKSIGAVLFFLALNNLITKDGRITFEVVREIIQNTPITIDQKDIDFLMTLIIKGDNEAAFVELVAAGANPFITSCEGLNPICYAINYSAIDIFAAMADFGKFIDSQAVHEGRTPIEGGVFKYCAYTSPSGDKPNPLFTNPLFLGLVRKSTTNIFRLMFHFGISYNDRLFKLLFPVPFPLLAAMFDRWDVVALSINAASTSNPLDIVSGVDEKGLYLLSNINPDLPIHPDFVTCDVRNLAAYAILTNSDANINIALRAGSPLPSTIDERPLMQYLADNNMQTAIDTINAYLENPVVVDNMKAIITETASVVDSAAETINKVDLSATEPKPTSNPIHTTPSASFSTYSRPTYLSRNASSFPVNTSNFSALSRTLVRGARALTRL